MFIKFSKLFLLTIAFIFASKGLLSQNTGKEFIYDRETGCRTVRQVLTLKKETANTKNEVVKYEDVFQNIKVTIYPNPNGGRFKIKLEGLEQEQKADFYLSTISGKIIYQKKYHSNILEVNIEDKKNGAYILYLNLNGKLKSWKIIKL